MIYTLFVWTVVAAIPVGNNYSNERLFHEWRPLAEVAGIPENCERVARELNIPKERYRCIRTR